jgi:hypothetical protein
MQQSNKHKFHYRLVAQCFYIYSTNLLQVLAIYPGNLQGATGLSDVYSIYGNLSQINGRLYTYCSFVTRVSQLKIYDFSGETFKGFEVL